MGKSSQTRSEQDRSTKTEEAKLNIMERLKVV